MSSALVLAFSCDKDQKPSDLDEYDPMNRYDDVEPSVKPGDNTDYYPKAEGSLRIMSYNVGAFSKFMSNSSSTIAAMIKEVEADVVGLNELDSCNTRHKVNQVAELAQNLGGWNWYFGRAMDYKGGAYGNGVVTPKNVKMIDKYFVTLPKPPTVNGDEKEQRSIAVVETDKYVIGATHLQGGDMPQISVIMNWVEKNYKNYDKPVFLVGDTNATPDSEAINTLKGAWTIISKAEKTVSVNQPTRCIDYVFHYKKSKAVTVTNGGTMTKFRTGDPTKTSDHLPVFADVKF